MLFAVLVVFTTICDVHLNPGRFVHALIKSAPAKKSRSSKRTLSFTEEIQRCITPQDVLDLAPKLRPSDKSPNSSLILIRISKQIITLDNMAASTSWRDGLLQDGEKWERVVEAMSFTLQDLDLLKENKALLDQAIEGVKAASVLSRLIPELQVVWEPLSTNLDLQSSRLAPLLKPHHLSGLKWAYDCFNMNSSGKTQWHLPQPLRECYNELRLPFRIRPNFLQDVKDLTVSNLVSQVTSFRADDIRSASNRVVKERRKTAWEGDDGVSPFTYSGKSMKTHPWSPIVRSVRDSLIDKTGIYYDCCLLNLYNDGNSGMRYHSDPDQGILWDYETAVVSIGATRKFAFRPLHAQVQEAVKQEQTPHTFVLMGGDLTEMFGNCQARFQHTVKTADDKKEEATRASLVFKKTLAT